MAGYPEKHNMILHSGPPRYYTFPEFDEGPLIHGVFTRLDGYSKPPFASLNVGHTVGDDPHAVQANHRAIYHVLGLDGADVVAAHQVHGTQVGVVRKPTPRVYAATDALITDRPGLALMLRFADCVPILLWARDRGAVGLVHAGWRGTVQGVVTHAVAALGREYGVHPREIVAAIGPSIGPCCYEVGPEVIEQVLMAFPNDTLLRPSGCEGHAYMDLWKANASQLKALGIEEIHVARLCTCCHCDLFFSHRGDSGRTGRFAVIIGLCPG